MAARDLRQWCEGTNMTVTVKLLVVLFGGCGSGTVNATATMVSRLRRSSGGNHKADDKGGYDGGSFEFKKA